jgi:hypothetical protein
MLQTGFVCDFRGIPPDLWGGLQLLGKREVVKSLSLRPGQEADISSRTSPRFVRGLERAADLGQHSLAHRQDGPER